MRNRSKESRPGGFIGLPSLSAAWFCYEPLFGAEMLRG